jgi:hypothetical protein
MPQRPVSAATPRTGAAGRTETARKWRHGCCCCCGCCYCSERMDISPSGSADGGGGYCGCKDTKPPVTTRPIQEFIRSLLRRFAVLRRYRTMIPHQGMLAVCDSLARLSQTTRRIFSPDSRRCVRSRKPTSGPGAAAVIRAIPRALRAMTFLLPHRCTALIQPIVHIVNYRYLTSSWWRPNDC